MTSTPSVTRVLVPTGALGIGVREDEMEMGLGLEPHVIAVDAGSTDSGPAALATGRSKYSRHAVKRDLSLLMRLQARARVPLLVGSCGTSGCDQAVDWTLDIAREIARENGLSPRIAVLYSEQDKTLLKAKAALDFVHPLRPARPLDDATVDSCEHIVALLGPEPYIAAVQGGADIVLGGRTSDPAVLAAMPLMRGAHPGAAWHAGKVAECGGLCSTNPLSPGVMITVDQLGFTVAPLSPANRCTPETVSAHMLYENSDPFRLTEPGGVLDVTDARYEAVDARTVRVTGSRFERAPYTHKLEGASRGPFQTLMLIGIQDPEVLRDLDGFLARMSTALRERLERNIGPAAADVHISLRPYGWNAVLERAPPNGTAPPREVGLLMVSTAPTQELATEAAMTCNPTFFHLPARDGLPKPSYAFPFSPAEVERGQVFEFRLNHVVEVSSALDLVRIEWPTTGSAQRRGGEFA
jgi:Acyclic terpene utilisation family protein AtuA